MSRRIIATCKDCGDVEVASRDTSLVLYDDAPEIALIAFQCSECSVRTSYKVTEARQKMSLYGDTDVRIVVSSLPTFSRPMEFGVDEEYVDSGVSFLNNHDYLAAYANPDALC